VGSSPMWVQLGRRPPTSRDVWGVAWGYVASPHNVSWHDRQTAAPDGTFRINFRPGPLIASHPVSENIFERQLHHTVSAFAGHQAKIGTCGIIVCPIPIRVVQQVEDLPAQLYPLLFSDGNVLPQTGVDVPETGIIEAVLRLTAERPWNRGDPHKRLTCCTILDGSIRQLPA